MDHEADRHQAFAVVIEERAASGTIVERPPESVLHQAGPMAIRRDLPQFLEADAEFRRLAVAVKPEADDQRLGQMAARAFAEQRVLAAQLHAAGEGVLRLAATADAHVAGRNTGDLAVLPE